MLKHTVNLTIYFSRHFLLVAVAFLIEFFFSFALILFVFSPVGKIPYILNTHAYTTRHVKAQGAKKREPLQELSFYLAYILFIGMLSNVNLSKPNILTTT